MCKMKSIYPLLLFKLFLNLFLFVSLSESSPVFNKCVETILYKCDNKETLYPNSSSGVIVATSPIRMVLPSKNIESLDLSCHDSPCRFKNFNNENYDKIKYFNASGNHLVNRSEVLARLGQSLTVLDLSHCPNQTFNMRWLKKFGELKEVYLSNTTLSNVTSDVFHTHSKLANLSLSYTNLTDEHFNMFSMKFSNLETLDLQGNSLHQLDVVTPDNFPRLKYLGISKNLFHCADLNEFLGIWANKSLNFISNLTKGLDNVNGIDCHWNGPRRCQQSMLTMVFIAIPACLIICYLFTVIVPVFWCCLSKGASNVQNKSDDYDGDVYDAVYDNIQDSLKQFEEYSEPFDHDDSEYWSSDEEMYVTPERIEMNIMKEVNQQTGGIKNLNHMNFSNQSNQPHRSVCMNQSNHLNRLNHYNLNYPNHSYRPNQPNHLDRQGRLDHSNQRNCSYRPH